jgi:hypothetical protein
MKPHLVIDSRVNRLLVPDIEHKEMPDHEDCGLPEHPIYANYTKYLWTSHTKTGGIQPDKRLAGTKPWRRPR